MQNVSLKARIVVLLLLASLIPFLCTVAVSYSAITTLLEEKLQAGVAANLHQIRLSVEGTLQSLNHVSQQLSVGPTVELVDQYLTARGPASVSIARTHLREQVSNFAFTNPSVGLVLYWFQDEGRYDFETGHVRAGFEPSTLKVMKQTEVISYHVPHASLDKLNHQMVFSALRKVETGESESLWLYVETSLNLTDRLLSGQEFGGLTAHLLLDAEGRVVYTEAPDVFPLLSGFTGFPFSMPRGMARGFYWTAETSDMGWTVLNVIPRDAYDRVKDQWLLLVWALGLTFLLSGLAASVVLWRWVYRPFRRFDYEINFLHQTNPGSQAPPLRIPEFDHLLARFQSMQHQVSRLIEEVGQKERSRADLEIETLRHQINPHFLLNSLNTIHWHAMLNKQADIEFISTALMRLLQYNLSRAGANAPLRDELAAIRDYASLQQTRYDFQFLVLCVDDPAVLETPVPRFVLQPLVENAITHGLQEGGRIRVVVQESPADGQGHQFLDIAVEDEGSRRGPRQGASGLGIGLEYVRRMLEATYGGLATLQMTPGLEGGTSVRVRIPFRRRAA